MILTLENKQEIVDYIGSVPKYQETFDEIYDHVITALGSPDVSEFSLDTVKQIINADFGTFERIIADEREFEKAFVRSCMRNMILA